MGTHKKHWTWKIGAFDNWHIAVQDGWRVEIYTENGKAIRMFFSPALKTFGTVNRNGISTVVEISFNPITIIHN